MLGNFARLQEALHARRLLDRPRQNRLVIRRVRPTTVIIVAVYYYGIRVVHNALLRVVQTGQIVVETVVQ